MTKVMTKKQFEKVNDSKLKQSYKTFTEAMKKVKGTKIISFQTFVANQYQSYVIEEKEINQPDAYLDSAYEDTFNSLFD